MFVKVNEKVRKKLLVLLLMVISFVFVLSVPVSAATKYYSPSQLGIKSFSNTRYAIKSIKGNTIIYYPWRWKTIHGSDTSVRVGKYKKATLARKATFYVADFKKFWKNPGNMLKTKHIRKVSKSMYLKKANWKQNYTDPESEVKLTFKNGKVVRVVQWGHMAG